MNVNYTIQSYKTISRKIKSSYKKVIKTYKKFTEITHWLKQEKSAGFNAIIYELLKYEEATY